MRYDRSQCSLLGFFTFSSMILKDCASAVLSPSTMARLVDVKTGRGTEEMLELDDAHDGHGRRLPDSRLT